MSTSGQTENVSTVQGRIAELASYYPDRGLTTLNKYLTENWLRHAFSRVRKDAAAGIDGKDARTYEEQLDKRLPVLVDEAKSGAYKAPASRRHYIGKPGSSEKRGLAIPTVEDKTLQRGVQMLIEPIWEETEFYDFSYGFRPGKSAQQAVKALHEQIHHHNTGWILEVDIRKFFDTLSHTQLREMVGHRVRDGVLTRLIDKWLKAGVLEDGVITHSKQGTPQGGVISPLLANIYLHEVLDKWYMEQVQACMQGRSFLIRYADDFIMGFERIDDAKRVLEVISKRFAKYGLELHPGKTRLVDIRKPDHMDRDQGQKPGTFDFLGFTHYWGKSRKGRFIIKHKTQKTRLNRALRAIYEWCRRHRHLPIAVQNSKLNAKLRGHFGYYGISFNSPSLSLFFNGVRRTWYYWLGRRDRSRGNYSWDAFAHMLNNFPLLKPFIAYKLF